LAGISSFSFRMARKVRPWRGVGLGINRKQSGQVKEDALLPGTIGRLGLVFRRRN
jgi:hypothetical protein